MDKEMLNRKKNEWRPLLRGCLCLGLLLAAVISAKAVSADMEEIRIGFAGDINFDENWATTQYMDTLEDGISGVFSDQLPELMNGFDFFMLNNEFTYSTRGEEVPKSYHFRADPSRVENLKILGTDLVLLANNHVYDYGEDAMLDTFETLEQAGIPYVGAGRNLEEAEKPYIYEVNGRKIAFVAATQAEMYNASGVIETQGASEDRMGVFECYDPEAFLEVIAAAAEEADYVIASIHWGMEYEPMYYDSQEELAKRMIQAGADAIIGTHTHCLQGVEFIDGKPVFYSLGNFWFNEKTLDTGIAELTLKVPDASDEPIELLQTKFYPCVQSELRTVMPESEEERRKIFDDLEEWSKGKVVISDDGVIAETEAVKRDMNAELSETEEAKRDMNADPSETGAAEAFASALPESSSEFSAELAEQALTFSAAYSAESTEQLFRTAGFTDLMQKGYSKSADDPSHTCAFTAGRKEIAYKGEQRTLVLLQIRGTSGAEWYSNFDTVPSGSEDAVFAESFLIAAEAVFEEVQDYLAEIDSPLIFICGHSRGAACANLLGMLMDAQFPEKDVFCYTSATPATVRGAAAELLCGNIFNLINPEDLVPKLPLAAWGFKRLGTDIVLENDQTSHLAARAEEVFEEMAPDLTAYYGTRHSITSAGTSDEGLTGYEVMQLLAGALAEMTETSSGSEISGILSMISKESDLYPMALLLEELMENEGEKAGELLTQHLPEEYVRLLSAAS